MSKKKNQSEVTDPKLPAAEAPSLAAIFEVYRSVQDAEAVAKQAKARVADAKAGLDDAKAALKDANNELAATVAEMMQTIGEAAGGKGKKKKPATEAAKEAEGEKKGEQAA